MVNIKDVLKIDSAEKATEFIKTLKENQEVTFKIPISFINYRNSCSYTEIFTVKRICGKYQVKPLYPEKSLITEDYYLTSTGLYLDIKEINYDAEDNFIDLID